MSKKVLVLGASGRFGRNAVTAFQQAGWETSIFNRATDHLDRAAKGVDVIVNAWNPLYPAWAEQVPKIHASVRQAALDNGCTVILPGNVYLFGPDTPAPWSESSEHQAKNPLGKIRIDMEAAYRDDGVRTIVLRGGDYLDTTASGNWFDQVIAAKIAKGRMVYPGDPTVPHSWAFLPDICRAAVHLADMAQDLPMFSDIPFPGYTLSGQELADLLARVTGAPVKLAQFPWWQLHLARPVWPLAKYLLEMRYLWSTPHWLSNTKFRKLCPDFQPTDPQNALAQAIAPLMLKASGKGHAETTAVA